MIKVVEIGQQFFISPFDDLQGDKGERPKTRCVKGALKIAHKSLNAKCNIYIIQTSTLV
jgi:hypothetical protein